jgi:hypothetical protein
MPDNENNDLLRLWKRHTPGEHATVTARDGERLVQAQSMRNAALGALFVIAVFSMAWAALSDALDRVWPWMTMLLGILLGIVVRRAGKGVNWRFPLLAATLALAGALLANILVAAVLKAGEMGISTIQVLQSATIYTWSDFFRVIITPADMVFALFAAGIAAFYAYPKLTRQEFQALKLWEQEQEGG